jgi:polysaccharide biosynthesis protein PslE
MQETQLVPTFPNQPVRLVTRDFVAIGFRHRRVLVCTFLAVMACALCYAAFRPEYDSDFKILVKKERLDPVVSAQQNAGMQFARDLITEDELNSEMELIKGNDLLRKVVLETKLDERESKWFLARLLAHPNADLPQLKIARAVHHLGGRLDVALAKKSNIIVVTYRASSPELAARVTDSLARLYLEKHMQVNRLPGQFNFFEVQAESYRQKLQESEARLIKLPAETGTVSGQMERDIAVQKLGELRSTQQLTQSAIEEANKRIATLEDELKNTPARMTTQIRRSDNPQLMQQLEGTLLTLELKRTELLQKFQPDYRPVQEVEQEIAKTRAAIEAAEKAPMTDATTDIDPTHEWMRSELAKARTDLKSLQARAAVTTQAIATFEERARHLNQAAYSQQDLQREAKEMEENYQLYLRKREEARITDALDRSKILNVSLAQAPSLPVLPAKSPLITLLVGLGAAIIFSAGAVFVTEQLDHSFRTPYELHAYLNLPVLAALPDPQDVIASEIDSKSSEDRNSQDIQ